MFAGLNLMNGCGKFRRFVTGKDEGASLIEYALLAALIAVISLSAVGLVGVAVNNLFEMSFLDELAGGTGKSKGRGKGKGNNGNGNGNGNGNNGNGNGNGGG